MWDSTVDSRYNEHWYNKLYKVYNKLILAVPNIRFPLYCFCNPDIARFRYNKQISLVPSSLL